MFRPKEVGIIAFDGVTASHLATLHDVFTAASLQDGFGGSIGCYRVRLLGLKGEHCTTETGFRLQVQSELQSARQLDTVLIPGGAGINMRATREAIADWLLVHGRQLRRLGAVGAGIYPIVASGLVDRHEVTTDWRIASHLQREFPNLRVNHKRGLVRDGNIYSAAGLTSGSDLGLLLIEEDYGKHVSIAVRQKLMLYMESPHVSSYTSARLPNDPIDRFGELVAWMLRHLDEHLTVDVLAKKIGMCPAHFTRAFKAVSGMTPGRFVENLRVNEARRRLSSPRKTLRTVAASVGFENTGALTRAFQVFGGLENALASCELYDPGTGKFRFFGNMTEPRQNHTATLLRDGRIMIAGGVSSPAVSGTGEILQTGVPPHRP